MKYELDLTPIERGNLSAILMARLRWIREYLSSNERLMAAYAEEREMITKVLNALNGEEE